MRDSKRIPELLKELEELWLESPDQRFGQLICNLKYNQNIKDVYYIEDEEWLATVKQSKKNKEKQSNIEGKDLVDTMFGYRRSVLKMRILPVKTI